MNVANLIRQVSQLLMKTTDPEMRADLEAELEELEHKLEELQDAEFKDWS